MGRGGTLTLSPPSSLQTRLKRARMGTRHRPGQPEYSESFTRTGARSFRAQLKGSPLTGDFLFFTCISYGGLHRRESFRAISTARLRTSLPVHLPPIYVVVCNDPIGDLILRLASCLDAFSTYPYPTRLPGRAPGGTTGWPEVGPTRSSRTSVSTTQDSCAHDR